jgi:hypothetical protein
MAALNKGETGFSVIKFLLRIPGPLNPLDEGEYYYEVD